MTRHDHDRKKRCLKVETERLNGKKKLTYQRAKETRETIARLEEELKEPVVDIDYKGEFNKVDNPFV